MRRRASFAFLVVALLCAPLADAQKGTRPANTSKKKPIRPGERGEVTATIRGTTKPMLIRVRNKNPAVAALDAGTEVIVVSSGGEQNTITVAMTGVAPGEPSIDVEVVNDDTNTIFRAVLRQVVAHTRRRIERLEKLPIPPGRTTYKLDDVLAILDAVVSELDTLLPGRRYAPFRDAIHEHVAGLRERVKELAIPLPRRASANGVVLVSNRLAQHAQRVDAEQSGGILESLTGLLDVTAENGEERQLCVRTVPTAYDITIYPPSYPPDGQTKNAASLMTVIVGKYRHQIRAQKDGLESNGELNFLLNPQVVIECPVKFRPGDAEACKYLGGGASPCR